MSDFITLACPSCAGNLDITADADRFTCKYCGRGHLVRRQNGIITVAPMLKKLNRILSGVDRHASELAIPRLRKEVRTLEARIANTWEYIEDWTAWQSGRTTGAVVWMCFLIPIGFMVAGCLGAAVHWSLAALGIFTVAGLSALSIYGIITRKARVQEKVRYARSRIGELRDRLDRKRDELQVHLDNVRV